jgi:hypothetical protein
LSAATILRLLPYCRYHFSLLLVSLHVNFEFW